jgi:lipopolysaccharide/colanic/teichoic acid biosynthesis glycosyltransferase
VNRLVKRLTDIVVASLLLLSVYPFRRFFGKKGDEHDSLILRIPDVLRGRLSLVGLPPGEGGLSGSHPGNSGELGPEGLTGLLQIHSHEGLEPDERERYKLYYAKNQSLMLDMQIIAKSLFNRR